MKKYLVLLLFLLGLLGVGSVAGQDQPYITEFRLTPINGTLLLRQPNAQHPVLYNGNALQFEVWATGGTVRFTQRFTESGYFEAFGEFAGPVHSTPIVTLWSGEEPVEFCAENRRDGGWENADRVCTQVIVYVGHRCVAYSQGGFGCSYEFSDYGPLTYYRPDGELMVLSNPQPGDCEGTNALPPNIGVGQRGRVTFTNGDPTGLYNMPQGEVIQYMLEGTEFTVIGGPECTVARQGHLWWSHIQLDNDTSGWSPYGYIGTPYWLEPVVVELPTSAAPSRDNMLIPVYFEPWGTTYVLEVNPRTCTVLNGANIVALEVNRFEVWMRSKSQAERYSAAWHYFAVNGGGEVEQFRLASEEAIGRFERGSNCGSYLYGVGTEHYMDMSGIGNIVFGYYMERYGFLEATEEGIAAIAQARNQYSLGQVVDNLDDASQRDTGAAIYQLVLEAESVATEEIVLIAAEIAELH